jgi:hypothetical protein
VCGEVVKIDDYGMVVVKEIQNYGGDPVSINVAEQLNIKPKDLDRYLKYKEGSFVQKNQILAQKTTGSSVRDILNSIIDSKSEKKITKTKARRNPLFRKIPIDRAYRFDRL